MFLYRDPSKKLQCSTAARNGGDEASEDADMKSGQIFRSSGTKIHLRRGENRWSMLHRWRYPAAFMIPASRISKHDCHRWDDSASFRWKSSSLRWRSCSLPLNRVSCFVPFLHCDQIAKKSMKFYLLVNGGRCSCNWYHSPLLSSQPLGCETFCRGGGRSKITSRTFHDHMWTPGCLIWHFVQYHSCKGCTAA